MGRLTKRTRFGITGNNDRVTNYPLYKVADGDPLDHGITGQCFDKLAHYEDLEEQGRLIKLPCKVGGRVYAPTRYFVSEYTITSIEVFRNNIFFNWTCDKGIYKVDGFPSFELGETVFLTKEEAVKALAEMGGWYEID